MTTKEMKQTPHCEVWNILFFDPFRLVFDPFHVTIYTCLFATFFWEYVPGITRVSLQRACIVALPYWYSKNFENRMKPGLETE